MTRFFSQPVVRQTRKRLARIVNTGLARTVYRRRRIVHLELTGKCDLSCRACYRSGSLRRFMDAGAVMSMEDVGTILSSYEESEVGAFVLSGGENLMHPQFFEIVRSIKERFPSRPITLSTNGTILCKDRDVLMTLCSSEIDEIQFSLHGARQETVSLLQRGIDLGAVLEAMTFVGEHSNASVNVNFVVQEENADEMVAFVDLIASTPVRSITFTPMNFAGHTEAEVDYEALWTKMGLREKLAAAYAAGDAAGVGVFRLDDLRCVSLYSVDVVTATGAMLPCWGNYLSRKHAMGNALAERPSVIRKKPAFRSLQRELKRGEVPAMCLACWSNGKYGLNGVRSDS